jgi:hypothetical protein
VEIFAELGFHWGGYYHDYMHFEFLRTRIAGVPDEEPPQVVYPFSQEKRRESPLKYYFLNERGSGGYFPLGQQQNLHAGVHLEPDSEQPLVPVKTAMPGYVVAARLLTPGKGGDNDIVRETTDGRHLGFALLRHELVTYDEQKNESVHPLYSLYMHLAPPDWNAPDPEFDKVPWLSSFLRMQHGAVVNLDPTSPDAGKTYWAAAPLAPGAATYKVHGRTAPLPGKNEAGQSLVLLKPAPADVGEALESFQAGSVVTFDRPLFPVEAGEPLGFVAAGQPAPRRSGQGSAAATTSTPAPSTATATASGALPRYLHWELFSTAEASAGLQLLLDKAKALRVLEGQTEKELRRKDEKSGELKELITRVQEQRENNFLELPTARNLDATNEIQEVLGATGVKLVDALVNETYGDKLRQHMTAGRAFYPAAAEPFTWPLTLTLRNPHKYAGEAGGVCHLEVLYKKDGKPLRQEKVPMSPKDQSVVTVTLKVPAAADALAFWSEHLFLDPVELSAEELRKQRNHSRAVLFQESASQHWRNVVLDHVNEWTPSGLDLQLTARREAGLLKPLMDDTTDPSFDKLKNQLRPLCWWSRPKTQEDRFGEVPVLGAANQEKSLFGSDGNLLPGDGKVLNMHPVTAVWLMDLLLEQKSIEFKKAWPPCTLQRNESSEQPPFLGLLYPGTEPLLGQELLAVLAQHGYGTTDGAEPATGVAFWVTGQASPEPRLLCRAPYTDGVAVRRLRFPFWGTWQVHATTGNGTRLTPVTQSQTTLDLAKPETNGLPFELGAPGTEVSGKLRPLATGTLVFSTHWPEALEGYVVFESWKVEKDKKLNLEDPATPGTLAVPAVALRPAAVRTANGLKFDNDFIVGKEKEKSNPKVTTNFSFDEFVGKPGLPAVFQGDAKTKFKLAFPLAQRLQDLRDLCKPKDARSRDLPLKVKRLELDGLTLVVGPSSGTPADLDLLMMKVALLKENPLFTAERVDEYGGVEITYTPPESSGPLHFSFDPARALGRMAAEALSHPGETLHVRPRFIAPNGGHSLMEKLKAVPGETDLYEAPTEVLKAACGQDFIEVVANKCLPPVARFEFGDIVVKMGQGRLRTEVPLYGDAGKWKAAEPLFKLVGGNLPSQKKLVGNVLQADWVLLNKDKTPVEALWGKKLKFTAEVSQPTKVPAAPPPVTTQQDIEVKPSLDALTREVKGKNLCFTGQGHYIPTDQDLRIVCEKPDATTGEWAEDRIVTSAIRYKTLVNAGYGRCTELGVFEASVPLIALKKAVGPFRFIWKPRAKAGAPLKVLGVVIEPPAPLEVTVAELEVAP